jgi:chromosome segregation ATPase
MIETKVRNGKPGLARFWGLVAIAAAAGPAPAQTDAVNAVIGEQVKTEEAAQASQKRVVQLDEETTRMLADYRQSSAEAQSLRAYNEQLATQLQAQQQEVDTMTHQLGEIEVTAREVVPMMQRMLSTLEQFVRLDLPFLPEERSTRIAQLKDMMGRADVSISEKYRRIVEAYQIEMDYGRTIEAYQGQVNNKTVELLRVGRVALLYQALDGRLTGYWDADAKAWREDGSYRDAVAAGLKVAKKQSAPDFLGVPLHAPMEAAR